MISRSACNDIYFIEVFDVFLRHGNAVKVYGVIFIKASYQRFLDPLWLLVDLLEHKVFIALFFCCIRIPCYMEHISFDYFAVFVIDLNIILCQDHSLIIFDQVYFSDVFQKSRNIGCYEVKSFSDPRYQRSILTDSYDLIRFCSSDSRYRISASHLLHRSVDCLQQISIIIDADQVCDDLRICF